MSIKCSVVNVVLNFLPRGQRGYRTIETPKEKLPPGFTFADRY